MESKHCSGCKEKKPITAFTRIKDSVKPHRVNKYMSRCKACRSITELKRYNNLSLDEKSKLLTRVRSYGKEYRQTTRGQLIEFLKTLRKYGLTLDQYQLMLERQNFVCAICSNATKLVIDHSHLTGEVRGLLCHACNSGIGMLKDSPQNCMGAFNYLNNFNGEV